MAVYGGLDKFHNVILSNLQGRSADYILNDDNKKIYLTGLIFGAHLKAFSHMTSWQIVQNDKGRITLVIEKGPLYNMQDELEIIKLFEDVGIIVCFDYDGEIMLSKRGKRVFMIQNCK